MRRNQFSKYFFAIALAALPAFASAAPYTLTIEGVDVNSLPTVILGTPLTVGPGMFVGLGNCGTPISPSNPVGTTNACDGSVAVGTNPLATPQDVTDNNALFSINSSNAVIFGYGLTLDQVIFHQLQTAIDVTNGVVNPGANIQQTFDFLVGSTGGGSAGTDPPATSVLYDLDLARNVTISNGTVSVTHLIHQLAQLSVGWIEDTLTIFASDLIDFDLGADGIVQLRLLAEGPITQGDPGVPVTFGVVSSPTTLALMMFGLGLVGFCRRRVTIPAA